MEEWILTPRDRMILLGAGVKPEGAVDMRQPITDQTKKWVDEALKAIPDGRRGAMLFIADDHGPRAHVAARLGESWKVAVSAGVKGLDFDNTTPIVVKGTVVVAGAW